jgi:stage II sporulation protein D
MLVSGHAPPRLAVAILLAALLGVLAGPADADQTFTITGHGYGHGVGMPQYGAEGYALAGGSYQQILALYYPGTQLGSDTPGAQIRVLLQSGRTSVQVTSATGLVAHDETSGATASVPSGATVTNGAGSYTVTGSDGTAIASGWAGPVLFTPAGTSPVELVGTALYGGSNLTYRGAIRVVLGASGLAAVNVLPVEDYLRGVVPSEMPSSWKPAALEAQAVAARGYALATAAPVGSLFDVYADTRSQAYAGMSVERPETDAAIASTSGQVLTYGGKLATTYFSSSSGGRTANVQEVFAGAVATPYLVAVDDPYDGASPYHDWTVTFTGAQIAQELGYAGTITGLSVVAYPSGRVQTLQITGSAGTASIPAGTVRTALALRSSWFATGATVTTSPAPSTATLTLAKPRISAGHVLLRGTAPPGALALQGAAGASWRTLATVTPSPTGTVSFTRRLGETPLYRLQQGLTATSAVRVSLGTGLTLRRTTTGFTGRLYPALRGRTVVLQRASASGWTWIARGTTTATGRFALTPRRLPAGSYRARFTGDSIYRVSASAARRIGKKPTRSLAWVPTDPEFPAQWNDRAVRAFDYWPQVPVFPGDPVTVAVVDGGIDDHSPDLVRPDGTSVVWKTITVAKPAPALDGDPGALEHGTAVAGIIAARANNGIGIAGLDQSVRLIDVRVVGADGTIDPIVEARGIQMAVDAGARVINLSLGGKRAPGQSDDEYSRAEQDAIDYAYSKGAVIVAAVGNSENPYPYASYPAALPHVIGVSAVDSNNRTPRFSNRDAIFNDLAAPGVGILTTVPRTSTSTGLSQNAPEGDVVGPDGTVEGTSFAAPHVSAAAALLFAAHPDLTNDQVMEILEHSAHDLAPPDASPATHIGHDPLTGFGLLDIDAAMTASATPPAPDLAGEPNDKPYERTPLRGFAGTIQATASRGDDPDDIYGLQARKGDRVRVVIEPFQSPYGTGQVDGVAWVPGTANVSRFTSARIVASTLGTGPLERLSFTATRSGTWLIEVLARSGWTSYRLSWSVGSSSSGGTLLK